MTNPFKKLVKQISTLNIYSNLPLTELEYYYLQALDYLFQQFEKIEKDQNSFVLYLNKSTFLVGNHNVNESINPFVFVTETGKILYDVDISVFNNVIDEFNDYIMYYKNKHPELPKEKTIQLAIKDYKNDKLDFYSNSKIITDKFFEQVRNNYSDL